MLVRGGEQGVVDPGSVGEESGVDFHGRAEMRRFLWPTRGREVRGLRRIGQSRSGRVGCLVAVGPISGTENRARFVVSFQVASARENTKRSCASGSTGVAIVGT